MNAEPKYCPVCWTKSETAWLFTSSYERCPKCNEDIEVLRKTTKEVRDTKLEPSPWAQEIARKAVPGFSYGNLLEVALAEELARALGDSSHSLFGIDRKDSCV